MRTLRFLCFASLLAAALAAGALQAENRQSPLSWGDIEAGETANAGGSGGLNTTAEPPTDSAGIRITMTGELPEDLQKKGEAPRGPAQGD